MSSWTSSFYFTLSLWKHTKLPIFHVILYVFPQNSPVPFHQRLARHLHKSSVCWIYSLQCQCEPVLHCKPDVWNQCFRWEPFLSYAFLKTASNAPTEGRFTCCQCLPTSLFSKQKCFNKSTHNRINAKFVSHLGKCSITLIQTIMEYLGFLMLRSSSDEENILKFHFQSLHKEQEKLCLQIISANQYKTKSANNSLSFLFQKTSNI